MNIYNAWHETQSLYTSCNYKLTALISPIKVMCIFNLKHSHQLPYNSSLINGHPQPQMMPLTLKLHYDPAIHSSRWHHCFGDATNPTLT